MSDTWNFPENTSQDVEKFLMLAQMEAHHTLKVLKRSRFWSMVWAHQGTGATKFVLLREVGQLKRPT